MERTFEDSDFWDSGDDEPPPTTQPSVKDLERLCPVKDKHHYFEKIASFRPKLNWNSDLEIIINGKLHRGTNIVNLVSAIYRPPSRRLKGDMQFSLQLSLNKILSSRVLAKADRLGVSECHLLYPYRNWANTTTCYERHWRYVTNDDETEVEDTEPYLNDIYDSSTDSDSE
jgi:hypothetical protein